MRGKVPNYTDFSDGQLDQAVEIKQQQQKDRTTLRKPGNKCQGWSAKIQPYSTKKFNNQMQQQENLSNFHACNLVTTFKYLSFLKLKCM